MINQFYFGSALNECDLSFQNLHLPQNNLLLRAKQIDFTNDKSSRYWDFFVKYFCMLKFLFRNIRLILFSAY